MKTVKRVLSLFLVFALLAGVTAFASAASPVAAPASGGDEVRYSKKIVSVVFDNSGSMNAGLKDTYAFYGMRVLLSIMNAGDNLMITLMNNHGHSDPLVDVVMAETGRDAQIAQALADESLFKGNGETPYNSVTRAIEQLKKKGMGDPLIDDGTAEYWLVVLSDGEFGNIPGGSLQKAFQGLLEGAGASFHMMYLNIVDGTSLPSDVMRNPAYTGYTAKSASAMVDRLTEIGDRLSGRFALDSAGYSITGNRMTISLNRYDFAIRSLSVLAQNAGAQPTAAVYHASDGSSETLSLDGGSTIAGSAPLGIGEGFVANLKASSGLFFGGEIELTFDQALDPAKARVSVTAAPGLTIRPYFLIEQNGSWQETDEYAIGDVLTAASRLKIGYRLLEEGTGRELRLEQLPGSGSASILREGTSYPLETVFTPKTGLNEFMVSLSLLDGKLSLFAKLSCYLELNPGYFRVEPSVETHVNGNATENNVFFTVYHDNRPVSSTELAAMKWTVTARDPQGRPYAITPAVQSDGRVKCPLVFSGEPYGDYEVTMQITDANGVRKSATATVSNIPKIKLTIESSVSEFASGHYAITFSVYRDGVRLDAAGMSAFTWQVTGQDPEGRPISPEASLASDGSVQATFTQSGPPYGIYEVGLTVTGPGTEPVEAKASIAHAPNGLALSVSQDGMILTQYGIQDNSNSFIFTLTGDGQPLPFDSELIELTVRLAGSVLPPECYTLTGDRLIFCPNGETMGALGNDPGDYRLEVEAALKKNPAVRAAANAALTVKPSVFLFEVVPTEVSEVSCFDLNTHAASVAFALKRDGAYLGPEELETLWNDGKITLESEEVEAFFSATRGAVTVEEINGKACLRYTLIEGHWAPLRFFFTSAFYATFGEKTVRATIDGESAETVLTVTKGSFASRLWRYILWILLLWVAMYLATWKLNENSKVKPTVILHATVRGNTLNLDNTTVNYSFVSRINWLRVIPLPWDYFRPVRKSGRISNVTFSFDSDRAKPKKGESSASTKNRVIISENDKRNLCGIDGSSPIRSEFLGLKLNNKTLPNWFASINAFIRFDDPRVRKNNIPLGTSLREAMNGTGIPFFSLNGANPTVGTAVCKTDKNKRITDLWVFLRPKK